MNAKVWFSLTTFLFLAFALAEVQKVGTVGDWIIVDEVDPFDDTHFFSAQSLFREDLLTKAFLVIACHEGKPAMFVDVGNYIGSPEFTPTVKVKVRIGSSKSVEEEWLLGKSGRTVFPFEWDRIAEIVRQMINQRAEVFLIGYEDALNKFHTLKFAISGTWKLPKDKRFGQYFACLQ